VARAITATVNATACATQTNAPGVGFLRSLPPFLLAPASPFVPALNSRSTLLALTVALATAKLPLRSVLQGSVKGLPRPYDYPTISQA
jgi:hypothetical protein